ncbi:LAGLIDADG family homing endonuclease [Streptomyces arboris]|uniref:LAGLIDADG family homing endonuclease n=1 Tax=Streptomyces arboris TaxID=2600619 RepID=UPI003BF5A103
MTRAPGGHRGKGADVLGAGGDALTVKQIERLVLDLVRAGDVTTLRAVRDRVTSRRTQVAAQRATRYMHDPVGWARDVINWSDGEGLTAYQVDILRKLPEERRVAARGPHGLGKALQLNMRVPTPTGWSTIGALRPGDVLFDEHGKPCRVVGKSPVWQTDTYEVEFADGTIITTHGEHEWNAVDVYHRPKTPRPNRRTITVTDWRDHWAATRQVTTAHMAENLRTAGGQLRWRIPTARPLDLPEVALPVDPYVFGYWLGDGNSRDAGFTVHRSDWPSLQERVLAAGYHHGEVRGDGRRPDTLAVTVSTSPVRRGNPAPDTLHSRLRTLGVLSNKHIPTSYLRASVEQRRELVRGLWDSDGYRQAGGSDELTTTSPALAEGIAELLRSLGLVVRVRESDSKINGRVVGRRWRIAARFDFNPYRLPRYDWSPAGSQGSRHTQRTIVDIRKVDDQPTQCIEVDSQSHLFLAGESMVPTHNSAMAAITVLWFATTRDAAGIDWKILTTASAWRALSTFLWPEIRKWARRIRWDVLGRPQFNEMSELLMLNLKLAHGAATAIASNKAELIEGAHADSLLYLIDEAKVVPDGTWDAIEGAFSGGQTSGLPEAFALAISTPGPPSGRFYDIHSRKPGFEDWFVRHVTLAEAIAAGRISPDWAEQRARQWGRDSAMYANRVLGEFHASDEDSVIPLSWVEAAVERWHEWNDAGRPALDGREVVGVDVARAGGDSTVLAYRTGLAFTELEFHDREDTMETTARVQAAVKRVPGMVPVVDSMGVGGGVVDRLRELKEPVLAYTGAAKTKMRSRDGEWGFNNTRSAAYWRCREHLDPAFGATLMLPPDDLLLADLTAPTWTVTTGIPPKIRIEPKEDLVKRMGRSPDRGDAVVMGLFAELLASSTVRSPARPSQGRSAAASRYGRRMGGAPSSSGGRR